MPNRITKRPVVGGERMGGEDARGQLSAAAPTRDGWLYVSGALTPYDLENLCDQIATLGRRDSGDVHVEVELGGMLKNSPELKTLARRVIRPPSHFACRAAPVSFPAQRPQLNGDDPRRGTCAQL